jgi:hypothetical protein
MPASALMIYMYDCSADFGHSLLAAVLNAARDGIQDSSMWFRSLRSSTVAHKMQCLLQCSLLTSCNLHLHTLPLSLYCQSVVILHCVYLAHTYMRTTPLVACMYVNITCCYYFAGLHQATWSLCFWLTLLLCDTEPRSLLFGDDFYSFAILSPWPGAAKAV